MNALSESRYSGFLIIIFLVLCVSTFNTYAQDNQTNNPVLKLSGLVKTDFFFDTRQTVSAREGHFLLFPAAIELDEEDKDVNAKNNFNILPIQSRLSVNINGPVTLGADITGLIEGDFFGGSNSNVNMLRLRHAYMKMQWPKIELLIGQYWHPLFATSCYPGTVSFNTGSPVQPFSRAPQIRISYMTGIIKLSGALLSQRDYANVGPDGTSSKYLRDANFPEIQFNSELNYKNKNEIIFGIGIGYKQIIPRTKTEEGYQTSENVQSISAHTYFKHTSKYVTLKLQSAYLENGSELLTISGYAVKDSLDISKGLVNYVPYRTISYWGEIHTNGKLIEAGIFTGYTENLGTGCDIKGPSYLTANMPIKSLYRISPRIKVMKANITFAMEVEYTSALYGTPDEYGDITNTSKTNNTRFLMSAIYKF